MCFFCGVILAMFSPDSALAIGKKEVFFGGRVVNVRVLTSQIKGYHENHRLRRTSRKMFPLRVLLAQSLAGNDLYKSKKKC